MLFINFNTFINTILLMAIISIILQTIRILRHLPYVIYNKSQIKKTKCYQEILSKANEIGAKNIKEIYILSSKIIIETTNNTDTIIEYSNLNFPNLPLNKQGILLGTLISDLKCSSYFKLHTKTGKYCKYLEENEEYLGLICINGVNKKVDKIEHKVIKNNKLENKQKLKDGETW